jgi:hypothetical protein
MDEAVKAIAQHVISYAMLQRASDVITERQYQGIKLALNTVEDDKIMTLCGITMHALNDTYERQLKQWIESNQIIVRP